MDDKNVVGFLATLCAQIHLCNTVLLGIYGELAKSEQTYSLIKTMVDQNDRLMDNIIDALGGEKP